MPNRTLADVGPMSAAMRAVRYGQVKPVLKFIKGFTDGDGCGGGGLYTVKFNGPVIVNNHTGIIFFNKTTSSQATSAISSTPSGSDTIEYTVTWAVAPVIGDEIEMIYSSLFDSYRDINGARMEEFRVNIAHCLNQVGPGFFKPGSIYKGIKDVPAGSSTVHRLPKGANAVWLSGATVNIFLRWGTKEEAEIGGLKGVMPGGQSAMFYIPGYPVWFGMFTSISQTVNMEMSAVVKI